MKKAVRITLYTLFFITIALIVSLFIFEKKVSVTSETDIVSTETEQVIVLESETKADGAGETGTEQTEDAAETEQEEDTVLLFAGDVMIGNAVEQIYDTQGITGIVSEEILAEMQNADIMMLNNEFQFSNRGTPMEGKQYTFQTDPKYVQVLLDLGVDIVSLANNHSLDFGQEALLDTFTTLDNAGILHVGAGDTKERAEALQIIEVNGKKFGFLSATRVIPVVEWNIENCQPGLFATYDDTRLVQRIKESREECDFLTVYVHWGIEREAYPQDYQRNIAAHCFEAGADLIIGAHPHCLQGIEFMNGKPVFYSLGNYIFNQNIESTALVKAVVKADGTTEYSFLPAFAKDRKTELKKGEEAETVFSYMNEISGIDYMDNTGVIREK